MAVLAAVSRLVGTGEENVAGDDIYGGSDRLLSQVIPKTGVVVKRVNTTDLDEVASAIGPWMKLVWVESPTNPRQQISDIRKIAEMAHAHGALALVDNSIMSPVLSQPLELGAYIVMHSATKFIAGHSDVMAGVLAVNGERCDFLNFAKNTVCLQCDAKRPKRQLLPGEWECPQCNFLNYRRNMACFHCECKRPPDEFTEMQMEERQRGGPRMRSQKVPSRTDVSNAWNLDFDDNESDRADVATFEYADSRRLDEDFPHGRQGDEETTRGAEAGIYKNSRPPRDSGKGWTSSLRK